MKKKLKERAFAMFSLKHAKEAKRKGVKGFTLVELIVVIAIIGILAVVLIPNMMKYVKNAGLTKANDAAAKIADQAAIIATELEAQAIYLDGNYTAEFAFDSETTAEGASDFAAALEKAVPDLESFASGTDKLTIVMDNGKVGGVAYQKNGGYVGIYPNPTDRDGSADTAKNWDSASKIITGSST